MRNMPFFIQSPKLQFYPTRLSNHSDCTAPNNRILPIPGAVRPKGLVCDRLMARIVGSNPPTGRYVHLLCFLYVVLVAVPAKGRSLVQTSPTVCLCV